MAQQVEFPAIPNTKPAQYEGVVRGLLGFVVREKPDFKGLKKYMRSRSIFEREGLQELIEFVGIKAPPSGPASLTKEGQVLYDLDDSAEWRKTLFLQIAERNEILVKSVFDALAERLYSVNEMYRVITSYVYPGKVITLPHFKNWMSWVEATGMIKYIGIRWGPSADVKNVEGYLAGIDIEDILEEEEDDEEDDFFEEDDDFGDSEGGSQGAAAGGTTDEFGDVDWGDDDFGDDIPGGVAAEDDEDDDDAPATPAAAPKPAAAAARGAGSAPPQAPSPPTRRGGASASAAAPAAVPVAPIPTQRTTLTLRAVAEIAEVEKILELDPEGAEAAARAATLDEAEIASNLEGVRDAAKVRPDLKPLGLADFGIDPIDYKKGRRKDKRAFFLYRALVAATCAFRPVRSAGAGLAPYPAAAERFRALDESGALTRHFREGQSLDDVVTALVAAGYGNRLDILELVSFLALARQALLDQDDWAEALEKEAEAQAVWKAAYERLHGGVFTVELVWLLRELARTGLWPAQGLGDASVVPTQEVLDIAFRIGLLPLPYAADVAGTLFASRTLTGFCGESEGFEAGLLAFARQQGCAYDCPNRVACRFFCREKLRR